jgi:hypothetical protein
MPSTKKIKMPVRTARVNFSKHGYEGFTATVRLNPPLRVRDAIFSGQEDEARKALLEIFLGWQFFDEDGEPIPHTSEGLSSVPGDLAGAMVNEWMAAVGKEVQRRNLVTASPTTSENGAGEAQEFQTTSSERH